jgi:hypothetical protein
MAYADLKITFEKVASDSSPLVVIANRFVNGLPRAKDRELGAEGTYTASINYVESGIKTRDTPLFYLISSWFTVDEIRTLQAMWSAKEKRRTTSAYKRFIVDDETEEICEETTKTRAEVSGTSVTTIGSFYYYYPRILVNMPKEPVYGVAAANGDRIATFVLQDIGVKI